MAQAARAPGQRIMIGFYANTKDQVHAFHARPWPAQRSDGKARPRTRPGLRPKRSAA